MPTEDKNSKLGQKVEDQLLKEYLELLGNPRRQIWLSFIRGIFGGLGGVIGATVMVAILLYILQKVGSHLPLIGPYLRSLGHAIKP